MDVYVKRGDLVVLRIARKGSFDRVVEGMVREVCYSGYATVVGQDGFTYVARNRVNATGLTNVRIAALLPSGKCS